MAKTSPNDDSALPDNAAPPVRAGWFRFYFADERWEWAPEAARIHGYEPGTVTPTTALVMSHKHPDDHAKMAAYLERVRRTHEAISTRHRIIDAQGQIREVIVAGQELFDYTGAIVGTSGFYIDVTPSVEPPGVDELRLRQRSITEGLEAVVESRTVIDQLKGMLMLIYGIDADKAFGLLKWRSQETNTKVRALAQQLTEDFLALTNGDQLPPRAKFDGVFLTAHLRLKAARPTL
jgi:PAS domain S-box-containing protein